MSDEWRERVAEALGDALAGRCDSCLRPVATDADWRDIPEGEGEHLCWEPGPGCGFVFADMPTADELRADALLASGGVVAEMVAAAHRAEAAAWREQIRGHDRSGVMAFDREAAYEDGKRDGAAEVRARVAHLIDEDDHHMHSGVMGMVRLSDLQEALEPPPDAAERPVSDFRGAGGVVGRSGEGESL